MIGEPGAAEFAKFKDHKFSGGDIIWGGDDSMGRDSIIEPGTPGGPHSRAAVIIVLGKVIGVSILIECIQHAFRTAPDVVLSPPLLSQRPHIMDGFPWLRVPVC